MIIFRYLVKEILTALFAVTAVLLLIFLSNQLVRYLSDAAAGKMDVTTVLRLMSLEIPHLLGLLLPLGLFLGILLAYGRLYVDSEMTILSACGIGPKRIVSMTLTITTLVTVVIAMISLWLSPMVAYDKNKILAQAGSASILHTLLPGRFKELAGGKKIIYIENMSYDKQNMSNVFLAEQVPAKDLSSVDSWTVLSAKKGYQYLDKATKDSFFVMDGGNRYEGAPGSKNYNMVQFDKYGVRIQNKPSTVQSTGDEETMSTQVLWKTSSRNLREAAELQWRISLPLMAFLLAILAVPLSQVKPRQGKFAQLLPSILLFIVYANMLFVGRAWVETGVMPVSIGLWWVHATVFLLGLLLLPKYFGWQNPLAKVFFNR